MAESNKCVVAIRTPSGNLVKAFDVRISGHDVYVIYSDCSVRDAHSSYHASGQYHIKIGKRYVQWDGGPTATMEPMKLFRTPPGLITGRVACWTVGWEICRLDAVLPRLDSADMIVDTQSLSPHLILGFEVTVVGDEAKKRETIVGFPIIASHQFGNSVCTEIDAFVLTEEENELR
ncbi:MAG: hypothetical protein DMG72_14430 [Acidobacteria bacterium]|nr:MAG: hypothetical protein DMG72_14430 [Acidobacteriota bacterium]